MSVFETHFAKANPRFDAAFAGRIEVRHQRAGRFVAGSDNPSRPPFEARGILDEAEQSVRAAGVADASKPEVIVADPMIDFQYTEFGDDRPLPVEGTVLIALDKPGQPRYRVRNRLDGDVGRFICVLTRV